MHIDVVGGPDAGLSVPLTASGVVVGRSAECHLTLSDADTSRHHVMIGVTAAGCHVRDLGSTNGTLLDGRPVTQATTPLRPGESIRIGDTLLELRAGAPSPAQVRPSADGSLLVNRAPRELDLAPGEPIAAPSRPDRPGATSAQWLAMLLPAFGAATLAWFTGSMTFLLLALFTPLAMVANAFSDRLRLRRTRRRQTADFEAADRCFAAQVAKALAEEAQQRRRHYPDAAQLAAIAAIPSRRIWERQRDDPDLLHVRLGTGCRAARCTVSRDGSVVSAGTVADVPVVADLRLGPLGIAGPAAVAEGVARWCVAQLDVLASRADVEVVALSGSPTDARAVVARLSRLAEQRRNGRRAAPWHGPWTVLVPGRAHESMEVSGLANLLNHGTDVGITAICVDTASHLLPAGCITVAAVAGDTGSRLIVTSADLRSAGAAGGTGNENTTERIDSAIIADRVTEQWADCVASSLAGLADPSDLRSTLPALCHLDDIAGFDCADASVIRARWSIGASRPRAVLGVSSGGPFEVDLVRDGPHSLVAGTTGSGKSELLRTWVTSLALNLCPEKLGFVLIDYKGGAAFAGCATLPHTVGVVTDLDQHLAARALTSLRSELLRRERLFAGAEASDLDQYQRQARSEPLPRLLIVVDEFAALAAELPDFVTGLVGIAQRGRSLGVHLILATQRPAGVVSSDIRANMALRIALRTTSAADSSDVIDRSDAASLDPDHPGRAYVRTGADCHLVQTAISASPRTVEAIRHAAQGLRPSRRPWLDPLPESIELESLFAPGAAPATVPIGLLDLPAEQRQEACVVDLAAGGGVLFAGGARSGRSSALLTLATAAAQRLNAAQLRIHTVDCGSGALDELARLPHLVAATTSQNFELVEKLLERLETGLAFGEDSSGALSLLLIDGWERFVELADEHGYGRSASRLLLIVRAAPSARLTVALAGDRGALAPRVVGAFAHRYVLPLIDRGDYALAGIAERDAPRAPPPGRAVRASDTVEVQIALPAKARPAAAAAAWSG